MVTPFFTIYPQICNRLIIQHISRHIQKENYQPWKLLSWYTIVRYVWVCFSLLRKPSIYAVFSDLLTCPIPVSSSFLVGENPVKSSG